MAGGSGTQGAVRRIDAVVVGAGQAGLATSYHLARTGVDHVVLDAEAAPGGAWQHRWPTMRLDDAHHVHDLPGLALDADPEVPAASAVADYFAAYERRFALPVRRPVRVRAVRRAGERLRVETDGGDYAALAVVSATGTWTRPFVPALPGAASFRGRQLHTAGYRGPDELAGAHVLVVGGGASAVQLLDEVSRVARTTWVTRRPPVWREGPFTPEDGRAAVARVAEAVRAGRPPGSVVGATGLVLTPALREARARGVLRRLPMPARIVPDGVVWDDGTAARVDVILWCTGFRPALEHLAPLGLRGPGGGIAVDGTTAVREPRLQLVGYGPSASTVGATRAGREAARAVRSLLAAPLVA